MYIYGNISLNSFQNGKYFKCSTENQITNIMLSASFPKYDKKDDRTEQATDDNIIRRMSIPSWITKATDTHTEYEIFIAFLLQKWLHLSSSMLLL